MLKRRSFLGATACSMMLSSGMADLSFATAKSEKRLVVIILRGAMDGLQMLQPHGDPRFATLRPTLSLGEESGLVDLDGFYGLDGRWTPEIYDLWQNGELSFIQAVSTPYRDRRSHFEGQDILETGVQKLAQHRNGWLYRLAKSVDSIDYDEIVGVSPGGMLILSGEGEVPVWSSRAELDKSLPLETLLDLYGDHPHMHKAVQDAKRFDAVSMMGESQDTDAVENARVAAQLLNRDARICSFAIGGWDTHSVQSSSSKPPFSSLDQSLRKLRQELAGNWENTAVICITEFGRTVRENGAKGTDHGTGGMAILAGGAVNGGTVFGDWPGLAEQELYEGRDLMPLADIRTYLGLLLNQQFGIGTSTIEATVFPGMRMDRKTKLVA